MVSTPHKAFTVLSYVYLCERDPYKRSIVKMSSLLIAVAWSELHLKHLAQIFSKSSTVATLMFI